MENSTFNITVPSDPGKVDTSCMTNAYPVNDDPTKLVTAHAVAMTTSALQSQVDTKMDITAMDTDTTMTANSDAKVASQKAVKTYVDGKQQRKTYVNGSRLTGNVLDWTDTATTSGGNIVFHVTSDRTSTGTAMATTLYVDSIQLNFVDSSGVYARGVAVVSNSNKTITIPLTKQVMTGVSVVGIPVLGSASQSAIPNGVVVKIQVLGDAA